MAQCNTINSLWNTERRVIRIVTHKLDNLSEDPQSEQTMSLCWEFLDYCWKTKDVYRGLVDEKEAKKMLNAMRAYLRKLLKKNNTLN